MAMGIADILSETYKGLQPFRPSASKDQDLLRRTGMYTSKGVGRIVRAGLQSAIELSMGVTEGFHNAPKLWGNDAVRPRQQVSDLQLGAKAIGN